MHVDLYNKQMALHRSIIDIVKNIMFYTTTKMRQNVCNSIFPMTNSDQSIWCQVTKQS